MNNKQRSLSKSLSKTVEFKVRKGPRLNFKNQEVSVEKFNRTDNLSAVIEKGKKAISHLSKMIKQNIKKLPIQQSYDDHFIKIEYSKSRCFTYEEMISLRGFFPKGKSDLGISKSPKFIKCSNSSENEEGEGTLLIHLRDVLSPKAILALQFLSFVHAFYIKHNIDMKVRFLSLLNQFYVYIKFHNHPFVLYRVHTVSHQV